MKIGILTQPLKNNYGGLLQAYALQKVLKDRGHEVKTFDLPNPQPTFVRITKNTFKRIILKYLLRRDIDSVFPFRPSEKEKAIIGTHTQRFVKANIRTTEPLTVAMLKRYDSSQFDALIVGSDQVWRLRYSPFMPAFFLDFAMNNKQVKKIAYAASFGIDHWEFDSGLTDKFRKLASMFDAISVREDSGIHLCEKYLDVKAVHLIDPTLLLEKKDYIALILTDKIAAKENTLMVYVLDKSPEKEKIIQKIKKHFGLTINTVMPNQTLSRKTQKDIKLCIFPPVTLWLRGFMDAKFVVTDSFHGTIFSLLFNKPFIAVANKNRGISRFTSLLKMFHLEHRLIFNENDLTLDLLNESIDFELTNKIIEVQRKKSFDFLNIINDKPQ